MTLDVMDALSYAVRTIDQSRLDVVPDAATWQPGKSLNLAKLYVLVSSISAKEFSNRRHCSDDISYDINR